MAEQLGEPFDPRIPETFVVAQPLVSALERSRVNAAVMDATADSAFYQPGSLQRLDVLRGCRERHLIRRRKLAHSLLTFGKALEHAPPSLVTECAENEVEARVSMFNHTVEHMLILPIVNPLVE